MLCQTQQLDCSQEIKALCLYYRYQLLSLDMEKKKEKEKPLARRFHFKTFFSPLPMNLYQNKLCCGLNHGKSFGQNNQLHDWVVFECTDDCITVYGKLPVKSFDSER